MASCSMLGVTTTNTVLPLPIPLQCINTGLATKHKHKKPALFHINVQFLSMLSIALPMFFNVQFRDSLFLVPCSFQGTIAVGQPPQPQQVQPQLLLPQSRASSVVPSSVPRVHIKFRFRIFEYWKMSDHN